MCPEGRSGIDEALEISCLPRKEVLRRAGQTSQSRPAHDVRASQSCLPRGDLEAAVPPRGRCAAVVRIVPLVPSPKQALRPPPYRRPPTYPAVTRAATTPGLRSVTAGSRLRRILQHAITVAAFLPSLLFDRPFSPLLPTSAAAQSLHKEARSLSLAHRAIWSLAGVSFGDLESRLRPFSLTTSPVTHSSGTFASLSQ